MLPQRTSPLVPAAPMEQTLPQVTRLRLAGGAAVVVGLGVAAPLIWTAATAGAGLLVLGAIGLAALAGWRRSRPSARCRSSVNGSSTGCWRRGRPRPGGTRWSSSRHSSSPAGSKWPPSRTGSPPSAPSSAGSTTCSHSGGGRSRIELVRQERSLSEMREGHAVLVSRYLDAERALAELRSVVDDKRFEWRFGVAGQAALASLRATGDELTLEHLLADEAFAAVRDNFHRAFEGLALEARRPED